jgi:pSer/pThr/pTyr-binding forkhead associated (FHA) protein
MNETHTRTAPQSAVLLDLHTRHQFSLSRLATAIGRSIASDIVLLDKMVSRQHAVIYYVKGQFYLEDIGSTNGTLLNGKKVESRICLAPGDEIGVGISRLRFILTPAHCPPGSAPIAQEDTVPLEGSRPTSTVATRATT